MTNHRVFPEPASSARLRPGPMHWEVFADLRRQVKASANVFPDAHHAALAIENGAIWVTDDRGFARFPGLRWATLADVGQSE